MGKQARATAFHPQEMLLDWVTPLRASGLAAPHA